MMNQEAKLKLQAYLDEELDEREARQMAGWIEKDPQARALYSELHELRSVLKGNELEAKLTDSREFYWSKIERAIATSGRQERTRGSLAGYPWWVRILAPGLGVAVLLMVGLSVVKLSTTPGQMSYLHEIETPLEETSAISFHSQAAGMTVVWVQSQDYQKNLPEPDF